MSFSTTRLSTAGFTVAVATNQSGIGRKLLDRPTLDAMHGKMRSLVKDAGGHLGRIVYCPHHPDDACECRKPAPGLLQTLSRQYGVPLDGVPVVGDAERDVIAARAVNARPVLVMTGKGGATAEALERRGDTCEAYADLSAAAEALIGEARSD